MKNVTKRTIAAMSAAAMLVSGGVIAANGEAVEAIPATALTEARVNAPKALHGYLIGSMTVGKSEEEGKIAAADGEAYIYENDATVVLTANGESKTFADLTEGMLITYYVDGNAPQTLQLPVHYNADVIVIEDEASDVSRVIGVFDEELTDTEAQLKLNMGEETAYYSKTRDMFHGGKALVFYGAATFSIPAQTTPLAIVKLTDDETDEPEQQDAQPLDLSKVKEIVIGDKALKHIPVTVNGVQMLPVRAVAEALGYNVEWVEETKSVYVGHAYFDIDEDSYVIGRRAPEALGQAPVLVALPEDAYATTYVPATFFTEVLGHEVTVEGEKAEIKPTEAE